MRQKAEREWQICLKLFVQVEDGVLYGPVAARPYE